MRVELSVIILNYNVRYHLELCLQSVVKAISGIESEVIVVDNASVDESVAMVRERFPEVKLIVNDENVGFAKGNNQGVADAKGTFLCILNPDTIVPEDFYLTLLAHAKEKKNLGAIGVKMIDGTGNYLPESKRNLPTTTIALKKLLGYNESYYARHLSENEIGNVSILAGACMLMKRERFLSVGGFDEDFFMYGEDIDLSYRLELEGFKNIYLGESQMVHFKGESQGRDRKHALRFYEAMRIFYRKHFRTSSLMDGMVSLALWVAKVKGRPSMGIKRHEEEGIAFLSNNKELAKQFEIATHKRVELLFKDDVNNSLPAKKQIIFDAESWSFREILDLMGSFKNNQNTFRIRPSNCNFILGSDSSTAQGTVLKF